MSDLDLGLVLGAESVSRKRLNFYYCRVSWDIFFHRFDICKFGILSFQVISNFGVFAVQLRTFHVLEVDLSNV
ncbi:hypothetical protein R6Q59_030244 [Mikania micrantha]